MPWEGTLHGVMTEADQYSGVGGEVSLLPEQWEITKLGKTLGWIPKLSMETSFFYNLWAAHLWAMLKIKGA
jgi:hypothetical protein